MESLYKCIWMDAGVLSFRLCDREYDCEHCGVDAALRAGAVSAPGLSDAGVDRKVLAQATSFQPSGHCFYHPCHLWAQVGNAGTVRVGLDAIAASLLGPLSDIRIPQPGTNLHRNQSAWMFVGNGFECGLPSPVTGKVIARNEDLILHPATMQEGDRRDVWLARIRPSRLGEDLETLSYGRRVREWLGRELERIRGHLVSAHALSVGSLPDGGSISPMVLDGIDPTLRRALVEEILLDPAHRQKGR